MPKRPRDFSPSNGPSTSPPHPPLPYSQPTKYNRRSASPLLGSSPPTAMPTSPTSEPVATMITCTLPACPHRDHTSLDAYESHYQKYHINRCHECSNNFPTGRILECHIKENHDMFALVAKEKGEKIVCLSSDALSLSSRSLLIALALPQAHVITVTPFTFTPVHFLCLAKIFPGSDWPDFLFSLHLLL
ncbi:hypothetical protein ABW19_dt0200025 [Dactylella cylindrospora]|nr:hypothetical protein ABW19_dt0200025 [Dactylella cylindrospora]